MIEDEEWIDQPGRKIRVAARADVVVVGGGPGDFPQPSLPPVMG